MVKEYSKRLLFVKRKVRWSCRPRRGGLRGGPRIVVNRFMFYSVCRIVL